MRCLWLYFPYKVIEEVLFSEVVTEYLLMRFPLKPFFRRQRIFPQSSFRLPCTSLQRATLKCVRKCFDFRPQIRTICHLRFVNITLILYSGRNRCRLVSAQRTSAGFSLRLEGSAILWYCLPFKQIFLHKLLQWFRHFINTIQSHLVRQNEWARLILACMLHPSTSHMAGWSYVIHGRLYFHPSMSSGSSISATLCIQPKIWRACSFYLTR